MQHPRFYRCTYTAAADDVFRAITVDKWFKYLDVFCYDQNAYMGDVGAQDVLITANDIYMFPYPVNAGELYFKNAGAGSNTRIVLVGVELSDQEKKEMGIPLG